MKAPELDLLLLGGGLSTGILAWWLKEERPDIRFAILERGETLGGEHTWCFHHADVSQGARLRLAPVLAAHWFEHSVHFPRHERKLGTAYYAVRSEGFHRHLMARLQGHLHFGVDVVSVGPRHVRCADGAVFEAKSVIDGRGWVPEGGARYGWQKFFGLDLHYPQGHGLRQPILMDAEVAQLDGYRFFYCLPWDAQTLLIEDTRYSTEPEMPAERARAEVLAYAQRRFGSGGEIVREELGCLPIPYYAPRSAPEIASCGMRADLFHPTTGYSLPDAVRFAEWVCGQTDPRDAEFAARVAAFRHRALARGGFYRFLNRMMFVGAEPEKRYRIFERFYRLPMGLIERFYAGQSTWIDRVRILSGRPPIPVGRAMRVLRERREVSYA